MSLFKTRVIRVCLRTLNWTFALVCDDMLAVGPSDLTKNLLQELSNDMTLRWGMVTDKTSRVPWSFFVPDTARLHVWSLE